MDSRLHGFVYAFFFRFGREANARAKIFKVSYTNVGSHDDDGIFKVHPSSQTVGQDTVVQYLQQDIEDIRVRFFDFIEQHHAVRLATYFLGELSAFFVAYIARRRSYEARYGKFLHIFAHIYTYEGIFFIEEVSSEYLGQLCFTHTGRAEEDKRANRLLGVFEAYAGTLNGFYELFDGGVLPDYTAFQLFAHVYELLAFCLGNTCYGNTCHHRYYFGYVFFAYIVAFLLGFFFPREFGLFELVYQAFFFVAQLSGFLVFLAFYYLIFLFFHILDLLFELQDVVGYVDIVDVYARASLIKYVNGLIRQETVGDVAVRELHTSFDGLITVNYVVMIFVLFFDIVENLYSFFGSGSVHHYYLEASGQSTIFFDVLAVFVQGSSTNTLDVATRQGWLKHIGSI